jgi:hypothetical protein
LGPGGLLTFYGSPKDGYGFFGSWLQRQGKTNTVDNPRDMFDMLNLRERAVLDEMKRRDPTASRNIARLEAARQWRAEFFQQGNPVFNRMFSGNRAVGTEPAARGVPRRSSVALLRQLGLLMSRYWKVKIRDRAGAAIMFLQAPVIGLMLAMVFGGQKDAVPFWCLGALQDLATRNPSAGSAGNLLKEMKPTADHTGAMFFVVVSCVWFGTSNAAREIVTERGIYLRERMVNLNLFNYVMSKYVLLSLVCVVQCTMLLSIVFFALGFEGGPLAFGMELTAMVAVSMNATALGLLLSTVVASAEAAMALTPIALIPQVVLGGLMVPMTTNPVLRPLMYLMPARWGFEGSIAWERMAIAANPAWNIDLHQPTLNSPPDFLKNGHFDCATAQMASDTIAGAWGFIEWDQPAAPLGFLYGMTLFMMIALLILLKRRDPV